MFVMEFVVETIRTFLEMVLLFFFPAGESEPHQTKKINIVFGLDQSEWTSGHPRCE